MPRIDQVVITVFASSALTFLTVRVLGAVVAFV